MSEKPAPGSADLHDQATQCGVAIESVERAGMTTTDHLGTTAEIRPAARSFGDYEILCEIASGGMGVVYKARQCSLKRVVALKRIRSGELATSLDVQRFRAEAEAAANLDHPNIVPIYEIGADQGQHFFTMKLIEGSSLDKEMLRFASDTPAAVRLLVTVALAVHYAHEHGIIHRDLKPGNILLQSADCRQIALGPGATLPGSIAKPTVADKLAASSPKAARVNLQSVVPMITDFGLAKRLVGDSELTQSGAIVGTPSYMAPEQAAGNRYLTAAVDIYALGAILYEMLTCRVPFRAATPLDTVLQVIDREPVRPRSFNPKADRDLETICLKCLNKDPRKRYLTAQALADDLQRWLDDKPILARRTSTRERLWKSCKRRPAIAVLILSLNLVAALGLAGILWQLRAERVLRVEQQNSVYFQTIALAERELSANNASRALELLESPECPENLRGWEWNYLQRLRHPYVPALHGRGPSDPLFCVDLSPDGSRVVAGSGNTARGELIIWDAVSHEVIKSPTAHTSWVRGVVFRPDGRLVATASWDKSVIIWDPSTWLPIHEMKDASLHLWCIAFSPDGKLLAAGGGGRAPGDPGEVVLWEVATWKVLHVFSRPANRIWSLAFSPDSRRLAAAGENKTVEIWDLQAAKRDYPTLLTLKGHHAPVLCVAYSHDGRTLASGSGAHYLGDTGEVKLWNAASGSLLRDLHGHTDEVWGISFSPDNDRRLFTVSHDRTVKVWDTRTGQEALTLRGHTDNVRALALSDDGHLLVSASEDGTVRIWDANPAEEVEDPSKVRTLTDAHKDRIWSLAFTRDGKTLASASEDKRIGIWDVSTGRRLSILSGHTGGIRCIAFQPNGPLLASAAYDNTVRLWNWQQAIETRKLPPHSGWVHGVAFSPDGGRLATVDSYHVRVWDSATGQEVARLPDQSWVVSSVAFSPDGRFLASASWDQTIRIWDAARIGADKSPALVYTLHGHRGRVRAVAFSPDGRFLASASHDETIHIWDMKTGQTVKTLHGHSGKVLSVSYSSDGKYLASASDDETARVWSTATGEELFALRGYAGRVRTAAFQPQGRTLAVASGDAGKGEIKLWNLAGMLPQP